MFLNLSIIGFQFEIGLEFEPRGSPNYLTGSCWHKHLILIAKEKTWFKFFPIRQLSKKLTFREEDVENNHKSPFKVTTFYKDSSKKNKISSAY